MTPSGDVIASDAVDCCASCGKAEIDDVKLMDCDGGCDVARYCGDNCQQDHRDIHEAICKEQAAELRDEILFKQPEETHFGDCPICFLPMPIDRSKSVINPCCGKRICKGCSHANEIREIEQRLERKCPFCRKLFAKTEKEAEKMLMKRAEANDPVSLGIIGKRHYNGGGYDSALEYLTRAAKMGNALAHNDLADMYHEGEGAEKDEEREIYHLEEAAIAGDPEARHNLGLYEWNNKKYDRAVKHWIIAANLGQDESLQTLKKCYKKGHISKDDLESALRAHHAAVTAMKSPQREEAAKVDILEYF